MQIIIFFVSEEKLGVTKLQEYIERMKEDGIYRGILILQKKLSGPASTERGLVKNMFRIEDVRSMLMSVGVGFICLLASKACFCMCYGSSLAGVVLQQHANSSSRSSPTCSR